jgi:hypothetical protein
MRALQFSSWVCETCSTWGWPIRVETYSAIYVNKQLLRWWWNLCMLNEAWFCHISLICRKSQLPDLFVKDNNWHHQIIKPLTWGVTCVFKWHGLKTKWKSLVDEFGCRNEFNKWYNANNACLLMCCNVKCKVSECCVKRKWRHVQETRLYPQRQASHIFKCPVT